VVSPPPPGLGTPPHHHILPLEPCWITIRTSFMVRRKREGALLGPMSWKLSLWSGADGCQLMVLGEGLGAPVTSIYRVGREEKEE